MKRIRDACEPGDLAGKAVLVTGGARRVGAAICRRLHAAGANVLVHYRTSRRDALRLERELDARRPRSAECVCADLLDQEALPGLVRAALARFGRLDALVNNASSFFATPFGRVSAKDWIDLMGTNLQAPLFLSQAAAPELMRRRGAIVNIVDIHAERPLEGHLAYSIAKAGLVALTRGLARELAPRVRVNAVAPGAIAWPESGALADASIQAQILARTPLGRMGGPADVASAVHYLIGAPFVTGQILAVDGGRSVMM
ncbi:MAG: pteridine reductase [Burkholderiales bacterium]|nr:pteridine reductase [Burkholderiales bacterium]